ncbi:hypothetical protein [Rhizomicrobium electricum]|uniref:Uncharacterized protein n=1 Tax=Rhizomicrobium electricum TaxID=480070 RepID=A0ABP3PNN6_9PROT|nr:hypothetical protein [Rhizomicrobium electricum]NIJ46928.1 hypothetical protein [Rhizomicrobium electricum]
MRGSDRRNIASEKLLPGTGAKTVRFVCWYLAIELLPFIAIHLVYHKPVAVLVFPYVVFGAPALFQVPVYGLWLLDARGASPRLLGWCWFWLMQALFSTILLGMLIGGLDVHVASRDEAIWGFVVMQMIMSPIIFFTGYLKVLANKTAKQELV